MPTSPTSTKSGASPRQGGGTRNMTQVNMITAVSGNTITMRNPLIYDFAAGSPRVKFYFGGITRNSGVENLKLDHGGFSGGSYNFLLQYCDSCWIKGVDSGRATGYHFIIVGTLTWNCAIPTSTMVVLGPTIAGSTFTAITRMARTAAPRSRTTSSTRISRLLN